MENLTKRLKSPFNKYYNKTHKTAKQKGENMMIDYDAIGMRIKIARIKARMTQEALAEKANLTSAHISNIETGNTKLSLPAIVHIANALSISVDELLCDTVVYSKHVFEQEAQDILSECEQYDIRILLDVLKSTKDALQKDHRFRKKM